MQIFNIDQSNIIINEVNTKQIMADMDRRFNITISDEEFKFYDENIDLNDTIQFLLLSFYSKIFKNIYSIYVLNRTDTIKLIIYMKKYFTLKGMKLLPQICSAKTSKKFKSNLIKINKLTERIQTSSVYQNIISTKYKYVSEINKKDDIILKQLSQLINSVYVFVHYEPDVDPDSEEAINEFVYSEINVDLLVDEFLIFISII